MRHIKRFLCALSITCVSVLAEDIQDISKIQKEIDRVQQEIHDLRLKSISSDLKGNEYMRTEWGKYVDQIEESEHYDVDIMKLEKDLERLENKKRELLIQYKMNQSHVHE